jgi:hypothetical protein
MKKRISGWRLKGPVLALMAAVAATALPASASTAPKGKLTVVHAIPRLTVDVFVDGDLVLEDFRPGRIAGPVRFDPGSYSIAITPANSSKEVLAARVRVGRETDAAAVAYLEEDGDPTLGLFNNNQRRIAASRARLTVRHTAAAPEVDVRFKRPGGHWRDVTSDLPNGEQAQRNLRSGRYRFDVVLAGTEERVLGPATLELERRTHLFLYAWGSAADDTLALNVSTRNLAAR